MLFELYRSSDYKRQKQTETIDQPADWPADF